jgi:hypothetical protein
MTMDTDVLDRLTELEQRQSRFKLATTGIEGWENYFQTLIMQERDFFLELMAETLARFQRQILEEAKAMLDQALLTRVRGTYRAGISYSRGDVVALDGSSFMSRKDGAGKCPGEDWQLVARGARGVAGPKGDRGPPGNVIVGWIVDRSTFRITPKLSDNSLGPPLELRALFEDEGPA